MATNFTPAQQSAVDARNCDLAVSAAAGSGKTTVLTQRILTLLSDPEGIDAAKLAVVTFTKAAAQELEDRLYNALSEEVAVATENRAHLSRQLLRLSRAQISTIHSFAFSLIREYRRELGLGERVRIADPTESAVLQRQAVEDAIRAFLDTKNGEADPKGETLYRLFGTGRSAAGLSKAVQDILKCAASYPGGIGLLWRRHREAEGALAAMGEGTIGFWDTPFGEELSRYAQLLITRGIGTLEGLMQALEGTRVLADKYVPYFTELKGDLETALKLLSEKKAEEAARLLRALLAQSMPRITKLPPEEAPLKETCKSAWTDGAKKKLSALTEEIFTEPFPNATAELEESLSIIGTLLSLAGDAQSRYSGEKRERDLVDYADLEHLTLSLLMEETEEGEWVKRPIAERVARDFEAIFVDEYQDTNAIQDMIFRAIARPGRLFVVGDPKQSIYRFRGAEPTIFAQYKNDLPLYAHGDTGWRKILLSNNFRCDRSIIDLVNRVFRVVMDETAPDSLYQEEDRLQFSKAYKTEPVFYPAQLVLVEKPPVSEEEEDNGLSADENREAAYIAGRIAKILSDRDEKEVGVPFEPGDIAVICRTNPQIKQIKKSLDARGIPCVTEGGESLKEEPEYLFVTSLLSALDNPMRDIPLLGALSSPVFRFTPDALYRIRKFGRKMPFYNAMLRYGEKGTHGETRRKCLETLATLEELRREAAKSAITPFLFTLYRRFAIEELYSGTAVREALLGAAAMAEAGQINTPGAFCRYLEETELAAGGGTDGVKLMTIHKSKGLEFPIVFVSFLAKRFSIEDETPTLLISPAMGAWTSLPRLEGRAKINSLYRKAVRRRLHREGLEESKRVLYVALTRARSRLILTAAPDKITGLADDILLSAGGTLPHRLQKSLVDTATSPLAMLLPALRDSTALKRVLEGEETASEEGFTVLRAYPAPFAPWESREKNGAQEDPFEPQRVLEALSFTYKEAPLQTLPEKLSVSQLLREKRKEEAPELFPRRLMDFEHGILTSGAEKIGTATHQVMQFADFAAMEARPEAEFERLVRRGFLTEEDMALVEKEKVLAFFSSPLYKRMKAAPSVEHEKRFNVLLPAEVLGVGTSGTVLVQGVVDAWFENPDGSLTLLDFKTDRVKEPEGAEVLRERHGDQLRLYALAVEALTDKKVSALSLYSFALGKEIPVSL
ncbi:MAG: UvrD-helicase domain-containing protein [Clostridia bacterium]|nr:UvrD-helicase domain-containing protein [Clostridia bacterium]